MATLPKLLKLQGTTVDIYNAVYESASDTFKAQVPELSLTDEGVLDLMSLRTAGRKIMNSPNLRNEFFNELFNKVAYSLITTRAYTNPLQRLKKGILEMGESVEEIYIELVNPQQYNPELASAEVFKRELGKVQTAYHTVNSELLYKTTTNTPQLQKAFTSESGFMDLINRIVARLSDALNYDEFLITKYMISRLYLEGGIKKEVIPAISKANMTDILAVIKKTSNDFNFINESFNLAEVKNHSSFESQLFMLTTNVDALLNVESLSMAFNKEKREFMGQHILIDSFSKTDENRLAKIFSNDETYEPFTAEEKASLEKVAGMLFDENYFMIFDKLIMADNIYNPQGVETNHFLHKHTAYSVSPFSNAVIFATA